MGSLLGELVVQTVQEGGHVLAVDAGHALEAPRAVRVAVAGGDARTAQPAHLGDMRRMVGHVGEVGFGRYAILSFMGPAKSARVIIS